MLSFLSFRVCLILLSSSISSSFVLIKDLRSSDLSNNWNPFFWGASFAYWSVLKEYASNTNFEFTEVSQDKVKKEVLNLNVKKTWTSSSIPAAVRKQSIEIHLTFLTNSINYTIKNDKFPDKLKMSEVIPLYKKGGSVKEWKLSTSQSIALCIKGFWAGHIQTNKFLHLAHFQIHYWFPESSRNSTFLNNYARKIETCFGQREYVCLLLIVDLSKAFNTINQSLLLAKLKAYGFSNKSLVLMCSYLKNIKQKTQSNDYFNS